MDTLLRLCCYLFRYYLNSSFIRALLRSGGSRLYDTTDIKKGLTVEIDGNPFTVVDFQFVNPGKGSAFFRTKLKNLLSGQVLEKTYRSGEKLKEADVDDRVMEYIYTNGDSYIFMDSGTYDQIEIPLEKIKVEAGYLKENTEVRVLFYRNEAMSITLPNFVELEIKETGPADKGNTVTASFKPAVLESGGSIQVPMFLKEGDRIKIDTRTITYVERV